MHLSSLPISATFPWAIDDQHDRSFVLKMALRGVLKLIPGLRRLGDKDENAIVLKVLRELDVAGYEIVKKPGGADFTFENRAGMGQSSLADLGGVR